MIILLRGNHTISDGLRPDQIDSTHDTFGDANDRYIDLTHEIENGEWCQMIDGGRIQKHHRKTKSGELLKVERY